MTQQLFDQNYLQALRDRDPDAENHLITSFSRPVQVKLRARLRSPELIEDAHQETFLRVIRYFRSGKTLDDPARLPGFVHTTCNNVALEFLRSHTRQGQIPENTPDLPDLTPDAERQLAGVQDRELVRRVLADMPDKERQLLRRVFLDEADKDQVCLEFNVDRGYLRVLLHRARKTFLTVLRNGDRFVKKSPGR